MALDKNGWTTIYVASFVHWRSKKRLFAKDYGLKGFPIRVRNKKLNK
jgi:hypothetical protein